MKKISTKEFSEFLLSAMPLYENLMLARFQAQLNRKQVLYYEREIKELPTALQYVYRSRFSSSRLGKAIGKENWKKLYRLAETKMARSFHKWIWTLSKKERQAQLIMRFRKRSDGWISIGPDAQWDDDVTHSR